MRLSISTVNFPSEVVHSTWNLGALMLVRATALGIWHCLRFAVSRDAVVAPRKKEKVGKSAEIPASL